MGEVEEPGQEEEEPTAGPGLLSLAGVRLVDAPILLFVHFHKSLRAELSELRHVAAEAAESGVHGRDLISILQRRFDFFKIVYKYHCAAEDEVIFLALDARIKNVACTYSLEHQSIYALFDRIFQCLDALRREDEDVHNLFQELVCCIGDIETKICNHMHKEEEQVFPLLMQHFPSEEQASLVLQFICSVPIMILEEIFPWMTSLLSPDEQWEVMECIKEVVITEQLLQEVVLSWLDNKKQSPSRPYNQYGELAQFPDESVSLKATFKMYTPCSMSGEQPKLKRANCSFITGGFNLVDGVQLWHGAIRSNLKEVLEDLYQIRRAGTFTNLAPTVTQLKFFADILLFYSNALDRVFYPLWDELNKYDSSLSKDRFPIRSQIESLQRLLYSKAQSGIPLCNFVERLYGEMEIFMGGVSKQLTFLEGEVLSLISRNCTHEMQQCLLYASLHMVPLGLLKCIITWFSAHLSDGESKAILYSIKHGGALASKSLTSLLYEWIRVGCSGKISVEKFREDLQKMFNSRSSFLSVHIEEDSKQPQLKSDVQPRSEPSPGLLACNPPDWAKTYMPNFSGSGSTLKNKFDILYSGGINFQIFFPETSNTPSLLTNFPLEASSSDSCPKHEPSPMDHIFFFHKALRKDLEYLVILSDKLVENVGLLADFQRRFHLVQFLYRIHSDSEDEIAFPALEMEGKLENISHSYTIDHKLEVECFKKISIILDKVSILRVSVSNGDAGGIGQSIQKCRQLCVQLRRMCKSMHTILNDHLNREEIELWPLFRECLSIEDQEKIIGCMLGRTRAEILQEMIPWLMASITPEEQHGMVSLWFKATKNTMFAEWLGEWWEGMKRYNTVEVEGKSTIPPFPVDPLEVISTYLSKEGSADQGLTLDDQGEKLSEDSVGSKIDSTGSLNVIGNAKMSNVGQNNDQHLEKLSADDDFKAGNETAEVPSQINKPGELIQINQDYKQQDQHLIKSQAELESVIRRVSRDSSLDPQKKSHIIQSLIMSRWIVTQQKSQQELTTSNNKEDILGQAPSYRDPETFGCKHYSRNCKFFASCCNQLHTCIRCHDEVADHSVNRKSITKMMCMKCLQIQSISPTCSTASCGNLSMARYYCKICKLFDDEREIYHCPFCNLCRVGKGLGIDYFHCMNCNACMSRSLSVHTCREKCLEDNCPICHEYIFTSSLPVKGLPCGHLMHSACFQDYTCVHYTCPICSKSLGDMRVYFRMLDALLAEEKIPEEYSGQTQVILCNDCEKRGTVSFHWLYHKCSYCGSYNTRLL